MPHDVQCFITVPLRLCRFQSPSPTNHAFDSTECDKNAPNTVAPNTATKPKNARYWPLAKTQDRSLLHTKLFFSHWIDCELQWSLSHCGSINSSITTRINKSTPFPTFPSLGFSWTTLETFLWNARDGHVHQWLQGFQNNFLVLFELTQTNPIAFMNVVRHLLIFSLINSIFPELPQLLLLLPWNEKFRWFKWWMLVSCNKILINELHPS